MTRKKKTRRKNTSTDPKPRKKASKKKSSKKKVSKKSSARKKASKKKATKKKVVRKKKVRRKAGKKRAAKSVAKRSPVGADPVTDYAQRVVDGAIVAGPHVRAACARHLRDLEEGEARGLQWDLQSAQRAIGYFRHVLTVEVERFDQDAGAVVSQVVGFELEPSQAFIIGSLYGWKNSKGLRRFRRAYIEIGKGNGKSPLAAGIGHYMLTATGKLRAEVYSAATDKDQAAICFRDAVEMWRRSPNLRRRLTSSGRNPVWQLNYKERSSFYKPISSEKKGKSGARPYCALIDEIHEHPDNSVIEMLRAGTKGNQEALIFEITNSGFDRTSVCWDEHEYSIKVASGDVDNDSWFSYVCALDSGDDPFEDESCWVKANPLLGVSIQPDFIREQVQEAKGMPSKEALVRRLHFCEWTDSQDGWVNKATWDAIEADLKLEDYQGEPCYGGLDLSYTTDLSALAIVFPTGPDSFDAFFDFWKPKVGLNEAIKNDKAPYDLWAKNGYLRLTEGRVIKLGPIAQRMGEVQDQFALQMIAYDNYRHRELADDLLDLGFEIPLEEHPQGFRRVKHSELWMPGSFQELENAVIEGRIRVCRNPLLRWMAASTVVRNDPAGTDNRIPDKRRSKARIDGIVALAMAFGIAKAPQRETESVYETRGLLELEL